VIRAKRTSLWATLILINLIVILLYLAGRNGRRDHYVVTATKGTLSITRNNVILKSDIDTSGFPAYLRKGVMFAFVIPDRYDLPTRLRTKIDSITIRSTKDNRELFRQTDNSFGEPNWHMNTPANWLTAPEGGITCIRSGERALLCPPGIDWDNFRLEFDMHNVLTASFCPVYMDNKNCITFTNRQYLENEFIISETKEAKKRQIAKGRVLNRLPHLLRTIAFHFVDSYPHLLFFVFAFVFAQCLLLMPLTALCIRLESSRRWGKWIPVALVILIVAASAVFASVHGLMATLQFCCDYLWAPPLITVIVALGTLFTIRLFLLKRRLQPTDNPTGRPSTHSNWRRRAWSALAAISIFTGTAQMLYITSEIYDRVPHNQDAVAQYFHARMLARGAFAAPVTELCKHGHFNFSYMIMHEGKWFSQYPPGHILTLTLGMLAGMPWIVPGLVSGLTLLTVYLIAKSMSNRGVGVLAVWILIFSPFFQLMGGTFMNHTSAALYWSGALLFLVIGVNRTKLWAFACSGFLIVMLFATRPLTGVALGVPAATFAFFWALISNRKSRFIALSGLVIGVIPAVLFFLAFNHGTTGDPLTMGYNLRNMSRHVKYDPSRHCITRGFQFTLFRTWIMRRTLSDWPAFLSFAPILALFVSGKARKWDWLLLSTSVFLGVAYSRYHHFGPMFGPRYWYAMLPGLCILSARGLGEIINLGRGYILKASWNESCLHYQNCSWTAAMTAVILTFFGWTINDFWLSRGPNRQRAHVWVADSLGKLKHWDGVNGDLLRLIQEQDIHNSVVFVAASHHTHYRNAFPFNSPFFDSDVIFPLSLGSYLDSHLMSQFPGRKAYVASKSRGKWSIEAYPKDMPPPPSSRSIPAFDGSLPQTRPPEDSSPSPEALEIQKVYPGWQVVASDGESLVRMQWSKKPVIQLHPPSRNVPAILRYRGLKVAPHANHELRFDLSAPPHHPKVDTLVQVWSGKDLLGEAHTDNAEGEIPVRCSYDLSRYVGREIDIEIWVVATGWLFEYACVGNIVIE